MTLDQVPAGGHIFVDSNILVYHFQPHPGFGPMCHRLLERIERQDVEGYTSSNLLGEVAHRLMVIEAGALPGWAGGKVMNRLKQQPGVVKQLTLFQTAVESVLQSKIQVLTVPAALVSTATTLSRQHGLLTNDAVILALMQAH
jgi:predicted nucleic acid-binding protein